MTILADPCSAIEGLRESDAAEIGSSSQHPMRDRRLAIYNPGSNSSCKIPTSLRFHEKRFSWCKIHHTLQSYKILPIDIIKSVSIAKMDLFTNRAIKHPQSPPGRPCFGQFEEKLEKAYRRRMG